MDFQPPTQPPWFADLTAQVDDAFVETGAHTPVWANPHADRDVDDEEYSRCLDPGKYRILAGRVDAWVQVLADLDLAHTEDVPPTRWLGAVREPEHLHRVRRVRRVEPTRPDGLVLLLATTLVDGSPFGLDIGIADPPAFLATLPDCGCDACDLGSDELLEALDGWVLTTMNGGVVHARDGDRTVTRTINGWSGTGSHVSGTWLEDAGRLTTHPQQWRGEPWL